MISATERPLSTFPFLISLISWSIFAKIPSCTICVAACSLAVLSKNLQLLEECEDWNAFPDPGYDLKIDPSLKDLKIDPGDLFFWTHNWPSQAGLEQIFGHHEWATQTYRAGHINMCGVCYAHFRLTILVRQTTSFLCQYYIFFSLALLESCNYSELLASSAFL